jgi:ubiquinone/menaquinone biosynthesis C-methylase UbiE
MSFFAGLSEAERYARSRPYFHPLAIERASMRLDFEGPFPLALDIASGTGQSAVALLPLANQVIGIDVSRTMLVQAITRPQVHYAQARAEALPFANHSFPLVTTALAFHWFERQKFLAEARRVLRPRGSLVIYNNSFRGIMKENPSFHSWGPQSYLKRFPTPPRDSKPLSLEEARHLGFRFIEQDQFDNEVRFAPEDLVAYLTTQSNVVAALDEGRESLASAYAWLLAEVRPFFGDSLGTFLFGTMAWYLEKEGAR